MSKKPHDFDHDHLLEAVALVVVDVQERLLPAMADPETFIDRIAFSIEAAKLFGVKVIFTEQVPEKLGPTLPGLRKLAPEARVFRKSTFSAFQAAGIQDYLRDLNIYHLLIGGLETGVCIYQTALQATDLELDVTLLSDCLTSRRPEDDAFILPALTRNECHVLPSETVFYSMIADARNPRFRAYSELVKKAHAIRQGEDAGPAEKKEPKKPVRGKQPDESVGKQPAATRQPRPKATRKTGGRNQPGKVQEPTRKAADRATPEPVEAGEMASGKTTTRKPRRRRRTTADRKKKGEDPTGPAKGRTRKIPDPD